MRGDIDRGIRFGEETEIEQAPRRRRARERECKSKRAYHAKEDERGNGRGMRFGGLGLLGGSASSFEVLLKSAQWSVSTKA